MKKIIIRAIECYQRYLSPDHSAWGKQRGPYCRYTPSCSDYMKESIEKKGILIGGTKGVWRIIRCMPWRQGMIGSSR